MIAIVITVPSVVVYLILLAPILIVWWLFCRWVWKHLIERPILRKLDRELRYVHLHTVVRQIFVEDPEGERAWWERFYQMTPKHQKQVHKKILEQVGE
jgi:hypothetical protein